MVGDNRALFDVTIMNLESLLVEPKEKLSIFFVLSGKLQLEQDGTYMNLGSEDIFVVNGSEQIYFKSTTQNIVFRVQVSYVAIESLLKKPWGYNFLCSSHMPIGNEASIKQIQELKNAFVFFLLEHYQELNNQTDIFATHQKLFKVLHLLTKNFQTTLSPSFTKEIVENERIRDILTYIIHNYDQKISLKKLAEESYLSESYLSRLFKEQTGYKFIDYLYEIRLDHALYEIEKTNLQFLKIAMNNGFPSVKRFNQLFKKRYFTTPTIYRKNYIRNQTVGKISTIQDNLYQKLSSDEGISELAKYMVKRKMIFKKEKTKRQYEVDLIKNKKINNFNKTMNILNIEHISCFEKKIVLEQIEMVQKNLSFKCIRFYDFHEQQQKFSLSNYNEKQVFFEFLQSMKLFPIYQINLSTLINHSALDQWLIYIKDFIEQYQINFFGEEVTSTFYLEISVDIDEINVNSCLKIVQQVCEELYSQFDFVRIGFFLPEIEYRKSREEWCIFLTSLCKVKILPDFFSLHSENTTFCKEHNSKFAAEKYCDEINILLQEVYDNKKKAQLFIVEWDIVLGNANILKNSFFRAGAVLKTLLRLSEKFDGVSFLLDASITEPDLQVSMEEKGTMTLFFCRLLKRPLFFVLQMVDKVSGEVIFQNEEALVVRNNKNIFLLLSNPSFLASEKNIETYISENRDIKEIDFLIRNIPSGVHLMKSWYLDRYNGTLYDQWMLTGGVTKLDQELEDYLISTVMPRIAREYIEIENEFQYQIILPENACFLLSLSSF